MTPGQLFGTEHDHRETKSSRLSISSTTSSSFEPRRSSYVPRGIGSQLVSDDEPDVLQWTHLQVSAENDIVKWHATDNIIEL